jgi:hypothetical protein
MHAFMRTEVVHKTLVQLCKEFDPHATRITE